MSGQLDFMHEIYKKSSFVDEQLKVQYNQNGSYFIFTLHEGSRGKSSHERILTQY